MADIGVALFLVHIGLLEYFLCSHQSRRGGVVLDAVVFQEGHPLVQRIGNGRTECVDSQQTELREHITDWSFFQRVIAAGIIVLLHFGGKFFLRKFLFARYFENVALPYAAKLRGASVDVVFALT